MALVVAIAGMILPAICLISNRDLFSIPKIVDRKLALAVTKSNVSSSSLSNVIMGSEASPVEDFRAFSLWLNRWRLFYCQLIVHEVDTIRPPVPEHDDILV